MMKESQLDNIVGNKELSKISLETLKLKTI